MVNKKSKFGEYKYPILMIGGSIIVAILLVSLIGLPLWNDLKKNTGDIKTTKSELDLLTEKLVNLKGLSSREAELKTKNEKVLAALPEDKDISRLFVQYENIAAQSGITVKKVSEGSESAAPTTGNESSELIIPVTYKIIGNATDYMAFKNSLTNFEKALRLVSIDSFDISNNTKDFNVTFNITTYKRGQNE